MAGATVSQGLHIAREFSDHLPALSVLIPFLSAPLIVILGGRTIAWWLAFIASIATFLVSFTLLLSVREGGFVAYTMGGWAPPLGIEYRIDALNAFVLCLISAISALCLPYAAKSLKAEVEHKHHSLFYACWMLCFTGLLGMVATGDAFNIFVFLEISSLSTYVLVAMGAGQDKRALSAAYDYLIIGTIGATFFVIGIGMLYMSTGTLNLADLADRIAQQGENRTVRAGFAFIVVGIALKIAIYPLHLWLPKAYVFAPSSVSVFLSATATKAGVYVMMRFLFSVFTPDFSFAVTLLEFVFLPLAIVAMFSASLVAVFQNNFKRMLAYSSVAQIGYIILGIALLNQTGLSASIVHLFNHAMTKALLFMGAGALIYRAQGQGFYDQISGLGRSMPITGALITIGGLSLIGVPGTAGFISKWLLVQAALERSADDTLFLLIAFAIVLSSLLAVVYVWRIIEALYFAPQKQIYSDPPLGMLLPMLILGAACLYFGIVTDLSVNIALKGAQVLFDGSFGLLQGLGQ